jgi:hypothetical protein
MSKYCFIHTFCEKKKTKQNSKERAGRQRVAEGEILGERTHLVNELLLRNVNFLFYVGSFYIIIQVNLEMMMK